MQIDLWVALAGLIVGFTVGLTGMGGGALMTPILVLLFKVQPLAAVSSDLVAAIVMKPVGGSVHAKRGTVNWTLVKWLSIGSVPAAFSGVFILNSLGNGDVVQSRLEIVLGIALVVAAASIMAKGYLQSRQTRRDRRATADGRQLAAREFRIKPIPTLAIGVLGGLVVGMTSVGSGSLIIVALLVLYPMLRSNELVGTDLVQAIPLVGAAALGHILFGEFQLSLTASMLIGSVPGVFIGARLSSRARDGVIRPALVFVLLASGLKLVGVPTAQLGIGLLVFCLVALPIWGAIDAASHTDEEWERVGHSKERWIRLQALGAPVMVGFASAIAYFVTTRPKLVAVPELQPAAVAA